MIHLALLIVSFSICVAAFCLGLAIIRAYWKPLLVILGIVAAGITGVIEYGLWSDAQVRQANAAREAVRTPERHTPESIPQPQRPPVHELSMNQLLEAYRRAEAAQDRTAMQQVAEALRPRFIAAYRLASNAGDTEAMGQLDNLIRATYTDAPLTVSSAPAKP